MRRSVTFPTLSIRGIMLLGRPMLAIAGTDYDERGRSTMELIDVFEQKGEDMWWRK